MLLSKVAGAGPVQSPLPTVSPGGHAAHQDLFSAVLAAKPPEATKNLEFEACPEDVEDEDLTGLHDL